MNIAVILNQVPDTEAVIKLDSSNPRSIQEDEIKFILNPYDEYAVEEALQITENMGGEVIGICIGPDRSESAIRTALAMGVERAILVSEPAAVNTDSVSRAGILAAIIKDLDTPLILSGREVIDSQDDSCAAALAQKLDIPHVLNASNIDIDGDKLVITRDIEGETLEIESSLPMVISCQKGLNDPRYPKLIAIRKALKKEIKKVTLGDLGIDLGSPKVNLKQYILPPARSAGIKVEGEPEEVVAKYLTWLADEAKII